MLYQEQEHAILFVLSAVANLVGLAVAVAFLRAFARGDIAGIRLVDRLCEQAARAAIPETEGPATLPSPKEPDNLS